MNSILNINWYSIFYWLTVSDSVKKFFDTTSNIFTTGSVILLIVLLISVVGKAITISENRLKNVEEENSDSGLRSWQNLLTTSKRFFYVFLSLSLITWFGYVATPSKKDCMFIIAGGSVGNFITSDSSTKALPADVTKYLHLKLKGEIANLSDDAKKEIGIDIPVKPKSILLEKAKSLTKEELLNFIQNDTTILK